MSRLVFPCDTSFRISFCLGVSASECVVRGRIGFATLRGVLFLVEEADLLVFAGFLG